jgi:acyl-CoA synthetase (AMP-forming)/AMP-acid ligase II/thioesterase domain-containing protein
MDLSFENSAVDTLPLSAGEDTLTNLWQRLASETPNAPCVFYPGRDPLSFETLYNQILRVERSLCRAGLGRSSRIAGALPDGADASVAFYSVSAACAYAPLNAAESQPFFEAAFRRMDPSAVLMSTQTPTHARAAAQALRIPLIELEPLPSSPAGLFELHFSSTSASVPMTEACPDDLAMLLLTSGSTAEPKFVMHSHRTLLASARGLAQAFRLDSTDRCLLTAPLFHSLGATGGLVTGVVHGGSIIATPGFEADRFFEWMDEFEPTWFSAVPSVLEAIHAAAGRHKHVLDRVQLRFLRTVAAPMNPALALRLEAQFNAPLIHVYGMSEAAPISVQPIDCRKAGSVGVPTAVELLIVNENGAPMPQGEIGEVTVRGAHITAGYFRDPHATASAFRDGWFHTGDYGYQDADRHLFVTGRIHDVMNRGGAKISPREIESVFETHPEVLAAIAFPIPHAVLGEEVALAVVRGKGHSVSPAQLQRYATSRLACHKIPRQFLFLEQLPLLPSGKPNRRVLPRLFEQNPPVTTPSSEPYEAPLNEFERGLASVWTQVLGVSSPGIHDSFFDSGGDSLAAARLLVAISKIVERDSLPQHLLFEAPTIAELAVLLSNESSWIEPDILPVQPSGSRNPLFCIAFGFEYRNLIRLLNSDQPIFSIRMQDLDGGPTAYTVERVATRCIEALRRFQPRGPYQLAGWCFAGVVAFEMARQLSLEGEQVPVLALFDAHYILPLRGRTNLSSAWIHCHETMVKVQHHFAALSKLGPGEAARYFVGRSQTVAHRMFRRFWKMSNSIGRAVNTDVPLRNPDHLNGLALERYRPEPPYTGSVIHFWCAGGPPSPYRAFPGEWAPYVQGPMTLHEIPGGHVSMFESPNVEILAQELQKHLLQP